MIPNFKQIRANACQMIAPLLVRSYSELRQRRRSQVNPSPLCALTSGCAHEHRPELLVLTSGRARVQHPALALFVSTVPVVLDTAFKYWLFKGLNRIDPSASVTLHEIDRH